MKIINGAVTIIVAAAITCVALDWIRSSRTGKDVIEFSKKQIGKIADKVNPKAEPAAENV